MLCFRLLKTQSLSAAGGEEEGEEIRKTEGGSEEKQGNLGEREKNRKAGQRRGNVSQLNGFTYRYGVVQ